ncbi:MAG: flavodoxin domain-containing protein [Acidobacteriota bacterium]
MRERKRITCPESAHLEELEIVRTCAGIIIVGCSRFTPTCGVDCARECAIRMDRRDRDQLDALAERVLVVFEDDRGPVTQIAEGLHRILRQDGFVSELAAAGARGAPPPQDYDAVVVGSRMRFGRHALPIVQYAFTHRDALTERPSFLFSVDAAGVGDADGSHAARGLSQCTGWEPLHSESFVVRSRRLHPTCESQIRGLAARIADEVPPTS